MQSLLKASGVAVLLASVCLLAANGGVQASRMGAMRMLHHESGIGTPPSALEELMSLSRGSLLIKYSAVPATVICRIKLLMTNNPTITLEASSVLSAPIRPNAVTIHLLLQVVAMRIMAMAL